VDTTPQRNKSIANEPQTVKAITVDGGNSGNVINVFTEWTKRYGKIVRYKLFQGETVVLGDLETIKESFITNSPDVDSRCQWRECFTKMFRGERSIVGKFLQPIKLTKCE